MSGNDAFMETLKSARLAEAAQLDAALNLSDARALRLEGLRARVAPQISGHENVKALFDLIVQPGERPRLWIDLISSVEMEPDPKTYRLVQDKDGRREHLFETQDPAQMERYVLRYIAHRYVAHEKLSAGVSSIEQPPERYSFWELLYVWVTGLLFGGLGLLAWAFSTGRIIF